MDALILSCGTGGGHDSAARAIIEEMNARGHRTVLLNPYKLKSDRLADGMVESKGECRQSIFTKGKYERTMGR